jgi:hypothetical protein
MYYYRLQIKLDFKKQNSSLRFARRKRALINSRAAVTTVATQVAGVTIALWRNFVRD